MNILMMSNTYTPIVGGVERSIENFSDLLKKKGHKVLIVAPEFKDAPEQESNVVRLPALQQFNGTDFSVELPMPHKAREIVKRFRPDVIHSHHPFLIGDTAIRVSEQFNVPVCFTHHTLYERYTHYVPGDSPQMKRFVAELATGYANLCDQVIAPSTSIAELIRERGVKTPVEVIPTGIYLDDFSAGDGGAFRKDHGIPEDVFLVGHVGRIAKEKNLTFLCRAAIRFLKQTENTGFLMVGSGPQMDELKSLFEKEGVSDRVHLPGVLKGGDLANAYHAMDVFAFASHTETQGIVLVEAMACGKPVVGVDASGVREVIKDAKNGVLLREDDEGDFCQALLKIKNMPEEQSKSLSEEALKTAKEYDINLCVDKLERIYQKLVDQESPAQERRDTSHWDELRRLTKAQWNLVSNLSKATGKALKLQI